MHPPHRLSIREQLCSRAEKERMIHTLAMVDMNDGGLRVYVSVMPNKWPRSTYKSKVMTGEWQDPEVIGLPKRGPGGVEENRKAFYDRYHDLPNRAPSISCPKVLDDVFEWSWFSMPR